MRNNRKQAIENNPNNNNNQSGSPQKKNQQKNQDQKTNSAQKPAASQQPGPRKTSMSKIRTTGSSTKKSRSKIKQSGPSIEVEGDPDPVIEDQQNEDQLDEGSRAVSMSPVGYSVASPEKPKSAQNMSLKASGIGEIDGTDTKKLAQLQDTEKKQCSQGGYLKGTHASETRAKLVKANAQELQDQQKNMSPEKSAHATNIGGIYIAPQITQSQQQYIQKRKEAIEKEQAELQQLIDKHKPPAPQHRNHASVQSRYMKQAASVAANGAKKAEAAQIAKQQTMIAVKKSGTAQNNKLKLKEKTKNNQNRIGPLNDHDAPKDLEGSSQQEERKLDKSGLMVAEEKAINNYLIEQPQLTKIQPGQSLNGCQSTEPSPSHEFSHMSPPQPVESTKNTWSSSTGEGDNSKKNVAQESDNKNMQDVQFTRHIQDVSSPTEDGFHDAEELAPVARFPNQSNMLHFDYQAISKGVRNKDIGQRDHEKISSSSMKNNSGIQNIGCFEQSASLRTKTEQLDQATQATRQQQVAKMSQNYMFSQSREKDHFDVPIQNKQRILTQKEAVSTTQARYESSILKTQERKKSFQQVSQSIRDAPTDRYDSQLHRPASKSDNQHVVLLDNDAAHQKEMVYSMTETKSKQASLNALANFQTAEPLVSRRKKMQEGLEKQELNGKVNQQQACISQTVAVHQIAQQVVRNQANNQNTKAQSPDFYSSKVKFTGHLPVSSIGRQPCGVANLQSPAHSKQLNLAPGTDPLSKNLTQKVSSLFARNDNSLGQQQSIGINGSQSSKGLSFNQYMLKQQEQALHLQNPLLLKQQQALQSPMITSHNQNLSAHRPSKSQWQTQVDVQYQQLGQGHLMLQQNGAKIATNNSKGQQLQHLIQHYKTGTQDQLIPTQFQPQVAQQSIQLSPPQMKPLRNLNEQGMTVGNQQVFVPQFYQSSSDQHQNKQGQVANAVGMQASQMYANSQNIRQVATQQTIQQNGSQLFKKIVTNDLKPTANNKLTVVPNANLQSINQIQNSQSYAQQNGVGQLQSSAIDQYHAIGPNQANLIRPPLQSNQNPHSMTMKTVFLQQFHKSQQFAQNATNMSAQVQNNSQHVPLKSFQIPGLAGQTAISMIGTGITQFNQGIVGQSKIIHTSSISASAQTRINSSSGAKEGSNQYPINQASKKVQGSHISFPQHHVPIQYQQVNNCPNPLKLAGAHNLAAVFHANQTNQQQLSQKDNVVKEPPSKFNSFKTTTNIQAPARQLNKTNELSNSASNLFGGASEKVNQQSQNQQNGLKAAVCSHIDDFGTAAVSAERPNCTGSKPVKTIYIKFTDSPVKDGSQNISCKIDQSQNFAVAPAGSTSQIAKAVAQVPAGTSPQKKPLPQFFGDQRIKI